MEPEVGHLGDHLLVGLGDAGYRFLMEVLDRRGNTAEALTVYEGLRVRLREDLGTAPGPVTQELRRRLLGAG